MKLFLLRVIIVNTLLTCDVIKCRVPFNYLINDDLSNVCVLFLKHNLSWQQQAAKNDSQEDNMIITLTWSQKIQYPLNQQTNKWNITQSVSSC